MRKLKLLTIFMLMSFTMFLCPSAKPQREVSQINIIGVNNIVISDLRFNITSDIGIYARDCKNLTIVNCVFEETCDFGIYLYNVSDIVIYNNYLDAYYMPLLVHTCNNVTITYNTLKDAQEQFQFYNCSNIVFSYNNVFNDEYTTHPTNDYPRVSNTTCDFNSNYWSDYIERYPNATNKADVWDTPYQIDPDDLDGREHYDCYPLVNDPTSPSYEETISYLRMQEWMKMMNYRG